MEKNLQNPPDYRNDTVLPLPPEVTADAWAVDAGCSGNPGPMEYQGIDLQTGAQVFHFGPVKGIYSDSYNAILWVKKRKCKTKLERTPETEPLYQIIARAEAWLATHNYSNPIIKWETSAWGEIPADFGRK